MNSLGLIGFIKSNSNENALEEWIIKLWKKTALWCDRMEREVGLLKKSCVGLIGSPEYINMQFSSTPQKKVEIPHWPANLGLWLLQLVLTGQLMAGCTCFRGRGTRRRRSCSAVAWGPPVHCFRNNPSDPSGSWGDGGSLGHRTVRNTHPGRTPDRDWTIPEDKKNKTHTRPVRVLRTSPWWLSQPQHQC